MRTETKEWAITFACLVFFVLFIIAFASIASAQSRDQVESTIREVARAYGINEDLAVAIADVESGLNPAAVGGLGELGVFQLRPEFHEGNLRDVRTNATVAMQYMRQLKVSCAEYGDAWVNCWNLGPGYKRLKHPELFPYYLRVKKARQRIASQ